MMIRKDSKMDSFQRQVSALRQQMSSESYDDEDVFDDAEPMTPTEFPVRPTASTPLATLDRVQSDAHTQWMGGDPDTGIIAANSVWNGTLRSEGSLRVHGKVEGELAAERAIFIAEGAQVNARLTANNIVIAGVVDGTVDCTGRLEILPSGRVSGDVTAPTLVVHDGATVTGQLRMRPPAQDAS